jgi:hypothetical protein
VLSLAAGAAAVYAQPFANGIPPGLNMQSDPPGFGIVTLKTGQTIGLNVVCFDHQVGFVPPGPCRGLLMFHDAAGNDLVRTTYDLKPGETKSLRFTLPERVAIGAIDPCWIPAPGGRAVASVELFDAFGNPTLFAHPAAARMSDFNNSSDGRLDPGSLVGFNPQPDPPAFGMVTLSLRSQLIRVNVACFEHPVNGTPPDPCRGAFMFHDAAGGVVKTGRYELKPGEVVALEYAMPVGDTTGNLIAGIIPCVLPERGGRAVPNVEIVNRATGDTSLLINPAVDRMSQFQKQ